MDHVALTIKDHVAELMLNRPDKRNAVSYQMVEELIGAVAEIDGSDARVVVLHGAGPGFCAGMDIANFQGFLGGGGKDADEGSRLDRLAARSHGDANAMQYFALCLADCRVPVVAALHGMAFGAGFQLALGADIRIAAPDCKMSVMEAKWGLVPDMGGMVLMPRLTGADVIRRMTYTADVFGAEQMLAWGLVTELADDPLTAARALAATIAAQSPSAIEAGKRLIRLSEEAGRAEVLQAETDAQVALIGGAHQRETVMAFLEKRAPVFE